MLKDKVAILTGAGSGIGNATARRFHAEGASVVLADNSGKEHDVANELGDRAIARTTDVSSSDDVKSLIEYAVEKFGRVDILCNIAGVGGTLNLIADDTEQNFDLMMNVNLKGVFLGMKYAIPEMLAVGGGAIVNVASIAGVLGTPGLSTYGASKSGVIQLSKAAAMEYAASGIRVNVICPGVIDTPILDTARKTFPDAEKRLVANTPMGRLGRAEEVAAAILFFASDQSSYITGVAVPVDGGLAAG